MQIRITKGVAVVKATKPELKKVRDAREFIAAIPGGLGFDEEVVAADRALGNLLTVLDPPSDAPEE